jgi:hypothetical protein
MAEMWRRMRFFEAVELEVHNALVEITNVLCDLL